jgi:hypothetical protein
MMVSMSVVGKIIANSKNIKKGVKIIANVREKK